MKKFSIYLLIACFVAFFASCSSSDDTILPAEEPTSDTNTDTDTTTDTGDDSTTDPLTALTLLDVSYGNNPQQNYDLYLPAGRATDRTKVIVLIHGGGWTAGDKSDMSEFVDYLVDAHPNHAILNLNYVLASLTTATTAFPNQYLDVQAALNQIIDQQDELYILPEFGILGTSAGAHLAMMYDYVYDTTDHVKFVIDIVGPSDFTDPYFADDPDFDIALSLLVDESQYPAGTDYAVANSPAQLVSDSSSPTLLFYGDQDPLVPLTNGQRLDSALNTSSITHLFTVYQGGHGDDWSDASRLDLTTKSDNYITTYLAVE